MAGSRNPAGRSLLGIASLSEADLDALLVDAERMLSLLREGARPPRLAPAVVINLFLEPSTRTRVSFEIAAHHLGLSVINWTAQGSSHEKGETFTDTAENLAAMGPAAVVLRHPAAGAAQFLSRRLAPRGCAVINAGDGAHEHPSQALLDAVTLRQRLGDLRGKIIAIVGDIAHSRVARSNTLCLTRLGGRVRLCGPISLLPEGLEQLAAPGEVTVHADIDAALEGADAVMALRLQRERLDPVGFGSAADYHHRYGITEARLAAKAPRALVLHPGPINRGVELDSEVADGSASAVLEQVTNGVATRMAIWRWALGMRDG